MNDDCNGGNETMKEWWNYYWWVNKKELNWISSNVYYEWMIDVRINEMIGDKECERYSDGGGFVKIVNGMLMNV